ncbi:hypothetical protein CEXT_268381, partial [Caerostris extrusa]
MAQLTAIFVSSDSATAPSFLMRCGSASRRDIALKDKCPPPGGVMMCNRNVFLTYC